MIIGYFGNIGDGKTVAMTKLLKEHFDNGYKVYSNFNLTFDHTYLSVDDMLDIVENGIRFPEKTIIAVDEITLYMDSRNLTKTNRVLSYLLLQTRKLSSGNYDLIFCYSSQFPRLIDIRLWLVTTIKVICEAKDVGNLKIIKLSKIYEKITETTISHEYFIANDYFKYYDSYAIIKPPKSRYDK